MCWLFAREAIYFLLCVRQRLDVMLGGLILNSNFKSNLFEVI